MSGADILVLFFVGLAVALAVFAIVRRKKNGSGGCSGDCGNCRGCRDGRK